jgi:hypothetical protein
MRDSNLKANITTYDTMWTIFKPKAKVVAKPFLQTTQIFEVAFAPIPEFKSAPKKTAVSVWCWDWNGKEMTKVFYDIIIDRFRRTKDISQLACYPLEYHMDSSEKEMIVFARI